MSKSCMTETKAKLYFFNVSYTLKIDGLQNEYHETGLVKAKNPEYVKTIVCKELVKMPVVIDTIHFEDIRDLENSLTDEKNWF